MGKEANQSIDLDIDEMKVKRRRPTDTTDTDGPEGKNRRRSSENLCRVTDPRILGGIRDNNIFGALGIAPIFKSSQQATTPLPPFHPLATSFSLPPNKSTSGSVLFPTYKSL